MKNPSKRITWKEISRQKFLMVCAAIFFVYGIVFYYVPLAGWVMAFQNYKPKDGLFGSEFVGLAKFKFLFSDEVFLRDIRNTLAMGVLNLVTTFLMAIIFAILLNEVRNMFGKKLVQTVSYLPHFLSWIVVTGILHDALSSTGIINEMLVNLGILNSPINFFANPGYFWPIVAFANVWKETGWNAIVYLACLLYTSSRCCSANMIPTAWIICISIWIFRAAFVTLKFPLAILRTTKMTMMRTTSVWCSVTCTKACLLYTSCRPRGMHRPRP